jgi:predicted DsbA family dithiol-disulfide isomerase
MIEQNVPLRVDVVSDVMCPWCVIGYRQLACALDTTGVDQLRDGGI